MTGEILEGWTTTSLGAVAEVNPRHPRDLEEDTMVSFLPMPVISESDWNIGVTQERAFREVKTGYTHFAEGDVLFAKITPCMENGKAAVAAQLRNGLGCGTTEIHVLRPQQGIDAKYLYHFIHQESFRREAANNFTGTAGQLRVPVEFIRNAELPLPPTAEQRRIVAQAEAMLAKVRSSQQRLDKVHSVIKRFRQAVFAAACSGKLTADWRQENKLTETAADFVLGIQVQRQRAKLDSAASVNAKSSWSEGAAEVDENADGLPAGWCVTRICDISDCLDHVRVPVNKNARAVREGSIPYYGANGQVGWIDQYLFDENLVLVVEDETFIGREKPFSYVIRGKSWVNNHAHVLRAVGGMPVEYLNLTLSYYDFTPLTSGTTGRRKLNQGALRVAPLWVAPLREQDEIVRRTEALFLLAERLETRCEKAMAQVDRLTQSILAKAFQGELVPTEAELARREGRAYETAEQLLSRINSEAKVRSVNGRPGRTTRAWRK
jgi:type I restriction enzyme S subunit